MSQVRFYKVHVSMNKMSSHVAEVPEWEVPLLKAQWNDDATIIEDETSPFVLERKLPEPRDEFERLAQKYGPKHEETPFVAGVYGNFGPGVNALRDAIVGSTKPLPAPIEEEIDDGTSLEDLVSGGEQGSPVAAGGVPVDELGLDEGGDPEINFADLTGGVTEPAEAVA